MSRPILLGKRVGIIVYIYLPHHVIISCARIYTCRTQTHLWEIDKSNIVGQFNERTATGINWIGLSRSMLLFAS